MNKAAALFEPASTIHLPLSERVLDRLADILFATDEILDMIQVAGERSSDSTTTTVERSVRHVYDEVNELMKKLSD